MTGQTKDWYGVINGDTGEVVPVYSTSRGTLSTIADNYTRKNKPYIYVVIVVDIDQVFRHD